MSAYLTIVTYVVAMFFPLWIPIGITIAPFVSDKLRRFRRATA
jgi:hypothetical protein